MKLSEINIENLSDDDIQNIVYGNIEDNKKDSLYGICFGNSMLIKERVSTAVYAYKQEELKKSFLWGGVME